MKKLCAWHFTAQHRLRFGFVTAVVIFVLLLITGSKAKPYQQALVLELCVLH